ncbi:hypothetical protein AB6A40_008117 [Gnathostoma spinigerum]|uniref:Uncharacterized protein n=1 Tax=Gnathostoma spinigerum TaxID=75299 RepID=A0ABD6ENF8_9BILA
MSVVSSRDVGAKRELLEHRLQQWRDQKLFVDRLYQVCNNVHPGLALDPEAVDHIQMLLMRILFEMLECRPQKVEDVERCMRNALPASMCHWVTKFQGTNEELHNHTSRKGHDKKSRNAKSLAALTHLLHCDMKEHLGYKVDEKVVLSILSVIDYVAADILKWTGNYVKNIRQGDRTIGLQNLKIALNADKSLIELTDMLWNEKDDCGSDGIICSCSDDSQFHTDELTYERVCRDFKHDEEEYLRDLIFVINVFRRKLEDAFMENDENHISDIFGNVTEIHELTCKVKRILEDAIEMWDTPCIGAGLWDLSEAHEFDVYISYMELFQEPPTDVIRKLLEDPNYINFFKHEDSACGGDANCETFRLAVKYVLPNLLYSPVIHFFRYLEYVNLLLRFRPNEDDFEDLLSAKSYLSGISVKVENLCPPALKLMIKRDQLARTSFESQPSYQIKKTDEIQKSIDFWEGREIAYTCTTLIKEGDLQMVRPTLSAASVINETIRKTRGVTDRHVFLFDHLLLLVKAYRNLKAEKPIYKFKAKIPIRKAVIHDLRDTDELQHAFSIEIRSPDSHGILSSYTLFCKSLEDKDSWMTAVVTIQTRSLLDRVLDGWIKEEQKRTPLILPGIDLYRFNMPDNENNIVFEDYPSSRGVPVIRQGTLTKLIERLTYHQSAHQCY